MAGFTPPDFKPGQRLTAEELNELKDLIFGQIVGGGGVQAVASGGRLVIRLADEGPGTRIGDRVFRVTGATQDGANKRWAYSAIRLGAKVGAGYSGTWHDHDQDTTTYTLYSLNEFYNGSTGTYGNGVQQANLAAVNDSGGGTDGTQAVQPIPTGTPVRAFLHRLTDGSEEWLIDNLPNGVDGVCPVPA
jgi:hypothetical protein